MARGAKQKNRVELLSKAFDIALEKGCTKEGGVSAAQGVEGVDFFYEREFQALPERRRLQPAQPAGKSHGFSAGENPERLHVRVAPRVSPLAGSRGRVPAVRPPRARRRRSSAPEGRQKLTSPALKPPPRRREEAEEEAEAGGAAEDPALAELRGSGRL